MGRIEEFVKDKGDKMALIISIWLMLFVIAITIGIIAIVIAVSQRYEGNTVQSSKITSISSKRRSTGKGYRRNNKVIFIDTAIESSQYYKSEYYNETKIPYTVMARDTGKYGEYLSYHYLKDYSNFGGKFLFNTYLPMGNNKTTEIDLILLYPFGIFVIESKNYSGWIFGNENDKYWTQVLSTGKGKSEKKHFYNPVAQNKGHIRQLRKYIPERIPIYSMIVFSERCELKNITISSTDTKVIKRDRLRWNVDMIKLQFPIEQEEIDRIYQRLYPYTKVTDEVKQKHIQQFDTNR